LVNPANVWASVQIDVFFHQRVRQVEPGANDTAVPNIETGVDNGILYLTVFFITSQTRNLKHTCRHPIPVANLLPFI
jgi:hypothetical protein